MEEKIKPVMRGARTSLEALANLPEFSARSEAHNVLIAIQQTLGLRTKKPEVAGRLEVVHPPAGEAPQQGFLRLAASANPFPK